MNQRELNKHSYDLIVPEWTENRRRRGIDNCVVDFARLIPAGSKVLDVGCGSGVPIDAYLDEQGFSVVGIDISPNMIAGAKSLGLKHAEFLVTDFLEYEASERFDAIIAFDSVWHIEESSQAAIYPKFATLLKDGGYLLFTHGKRSGSVKGDMMGQSFYYSALDVEDVKKLLIDNGFEIVSLIEDYKDTTTGTRDLLVIAKKK